MQISLKNRVCGKKEFQGGFVRSVFPSSTVDILKSQLPSGLCSIQDFMESSAHGPVLVAAPVLQGASAETFQGGNAGEYNDISVGLVFYWLNVTEQLGPGSDQ